MRGQIRSSWVVTPQGIDYALTIPPNTTATVYLPATMPALVTEGHGPATMADGVLSHSEQPAALVLEVGSGEYAFHVP